MPPRLLALKFKEKLIAKSQTGDALLKKLKTLHAELAVMDQETVDTRSLTSISKELINTHILLHRDKGVKAYAACCLADLLRLYAPDAPYTALELKDIFQFSFRQLQTGLKGSDAPWFNEYVYLLESMATIKTVCLVPDLPHGDDLTHEIFQNFFDLVKLELSKKVELFMSDILVALIDESPGLPNGVLDILLAQFTPKNARMDHPTFRLAVDVCRATSDKLQGPVAQYFTDIIVQQDDEDETEDVKVAHDLIIQVNKSCPALLNNVVPQLGEELSVDNIHLRTLATQTLGEMFADSKGESLAQKYHSTWKQWITRTKDRSVAVRVVFVEGCRKLLAHHNSLRKEVEEALVAKFLDGDEKVRVVVCKLYGQLDYETALNHVDVEHLKSMTERMLDKKHVVRVEAFAALGKLYRIAYPEIETGDEKAIEQFSWIPNAILAVSASAPDPDIRWLAEQTISQYILPLPSLSKDGDDAVPWTEQLLVTMRHIEAPRSHALLGLSNIGLTRPSLLERYIQCCIDYNGGIIDEDEEKVKAQFDQITNQISRRFPDHVKSNDDLKAFAKLNEARLYKLVTTMTDAQVDLKTLVKSLADFTKRLEVASSGIVQTLTDLIRKHSLHIVNQSSIPTLVKRIQRHSNDRGDAIHAQQFLVAIAKQCPAIFKSHIGEFSRALAEEANVELVEISLQALAAASAWDSSCAPNDKRTLDRVKRFAISENPTYAKFATRILAHSKNSSDACNGLSKTIAGDLDIDDLTNLEARLRAIAELAKSAPDSFEETSDKTVAFLLKSVLPLAPEIPNDDEEWNEGDSVPLEARLKILAIKICVNRCIAHASLSSAEDVFKPVMRMLFAILDNNGSVKPDFPDHAQIKARLRLQATLSLLRLSTIPKYSPLIISANFSQLALMIQDPSFQVRSHFLTRLITYLGGRKLDPRFNIILFMTALDPEDEIRQKAQMFIKGCMSRFPPELTMRCFELPLPRLLHLIAVHPDFSIEDNEALKDLSDYLELYMDTVLNSENIHLLTFLAQKTKSVRIPDSHSLSENLYAVSELAQHKIRSRAVRNGWATNAYPGKVNLPSDIFRALPSTEVQTKILRHVYLPEEKVLWLEEQIKANAKSNKLPAERKPKAIHTTNGNAKKKRSPSKTTNRRVRKRKKDSETEEESSDNGEDSDDPIETDGDGEPDGRTSPARAPSSTKSDAEDTEMEDESEKPRRNAPRSARAPTRKAAKKKRIS